MIHPYDCIRSILEYIGEDPTREGLKDTPARVVMSYTELFAGYKQKLSDFATTFVEGVCDELVLLRDVEFTSTCEHHMLPFLGVAHIGYIPQKKLIGVSKLARILDMYARRLQIQERLTGEIAYGLDKLVEPLGVAVVLEASHLCMQCRGVKKQHSKMVTSAMLGCFRDKPEARAEFLRLIKG